MNAKIKLGYKYNKKLKNKQANRQIVIYKDLKINQQSLKARWYKKSFQFYKCTYCHEYFFCVFQRFYNALRIYILVPCTRKTKSLEIYCSNANRSMLDLTSCTKQHKLIFSTALLLCILTWTIRKKFFSRSPSFTMNLNREV